MALDMTEQQKATGKANFERAVGQLGSVPGETLGPNRRQFMKGMLAGAAVLPISAAAYFGYQSLARGNPVRAGLIGAGDEGGVLVGEHNPEYMVFTAVSDIRPSNFKRIFVGQPNSPRKGFNNIYGSDAEKHIRKYENYQDLLRDPNIEAVVIALPLHLHAKVTIEALKAGKHVLCEKLMAWNIRQCKDMIREQRRLRDNGQDLLLSIGHQRHYSLLYAETVEMLQTGVMGDIKHIRALWHRNNATPRLDGRGNPIMRDGKPVLRDSWRPEISAEDRDHLAANIRSLGYKDMEELVRWRLFHRTGGGLMAELGSHQLDACSIFLGKVHPLAVSGVGGKFFYEDNREVEDHVFCTFEFPGKTYDRQRPVPMRNSRGLPNYNDRVVVTYSSISTNDFEKYGECIMGSKGTLVVETEQTAMLWGSAGRSTTVNIANPAGNQPVIDTSGTTPSQQASEAQSLGQRSLSGPVSRGYREEMEHFAYCIKMRPQATEQERREDPRLNPRCPGEAAMADAIIALAANAAMRTGQRIEFDERWYEVNPDQNREVIPSWDLPEESLPG